MEYGELAATFERLESTSASLEKTAIIADTFERAEDRHLPMFITMVQGRVFPAWRPDELGVSTNLTKQAIAKATGINEPQVEEWWRETGDLGNAAARALENRTQQTLISEQLDVQTVFESLRELSTYDGAGSQQRRIDTLAKLISNASPEEARYIVRTAIGAMRLGVGDGTVRDAIAEAFLDDVADAESVVERAHQVTNDFTVVAATARDEGVQGLNRLEIELFRPVRVMLAQKAEGIETALEDVATSRDDALLEYKADGIRAQVHHDGDQTAIYTRRLEEVTDQFPEVVHAISDSLTVDSCILEGELVGYDPATREIVPFQTLSRRIKRKHNIDEVAEEIPVVLYLFDMLQLNGRSLLDEPLRERLDQLESHFMPIDWEIERMPNRTVSASRDVTSFYEAALDAGHEGLMVKNWQATYQPGSRVGYMMKLKPVMEPLDLVVTRAKYSEGRRRNRLGRLYLACRDETTEELVELGRMSTGFTDEELEEITERLEPRIQDMDGREVELAPAEVLEVEYEAIQKSPEYESGFALRFPRFVRFRDDLGPEDVDTLERVTELFAGQ